MRWRKEVRKDGWRKEAGLADSKHTFITFYTVLVDTSVAK